MHCTDETGDRGEFADRGPIFDWGSWEIYGAEKLFRASATSRETINRPYLVDCCHQNEDINPPAHSNRYSLTDLSSFIKTPPQVYPVLNHCQIPSTQKMKLFTLSIAILGLASTCLSMTLAARDDQIHQFERRYIDTLSYHHPNHTTKLVGFKKIVMTADEITQLESNIAARPHEWDELDMAYYDPLQKTMRVYFPVENALVYHGDKLIEANRMGEYEHAMIDGDCQVVGRYQTDKVTGVSANVISDGIIYLAEPSPVIRKHDNIHIYDFGWRHGSHNHDHGHGHSKRGEGSGGSCFSNHGGKVCSIAYNINQGRCTRPKGTIKECIDYNGWPHKNCKKHNDKWAFPGSDCFVAVARGHCWNEVEGASH